MKFFGFTLLIVFFVSCKAKSKADKTGIWTDHARRVVVQLADSLGKATVLLPLSYDTSFTWTHFSDCGKPCDKIKYRSQLKNLRITKESGWFWLDEPQDSIERFTISHSAYIPFSHGSDTVMINQIHKHQVENVTSNPETHKVKTDTVEKIGDRYFSLIAIDMYDTLKRQFNKKLLASTTIRGNLIHFDFELLTRQPGQATDSFLDNSKRYLRTIRLTNGK